MTVRCKPSKEDLRIIRDCAQRSVGYKRIEICPGQRYNIDQDKGRNFNIALLSDHPDWNDTDLWDNAYSWNDFKKGVELTPDGRGIFDFYVYGPLGHNKELQTNVVAYYEQGKLVKVTGTCDGTIWPRKGN